MVSVLDGSSSKVQQEGYYEEFQIKAQLRNEKARTRADSRGIRFRIYVHVRKKSRWSSRSSKESTWVVYFVKCPLSQTALTGHHGSSNDGNSSAGAPRKRLAGRLRRNSSFRKI